MIEYYGNKHKENWSQLGMEDRIFGLNVTELRSQLLSRVSCLPFQLVGIYNLAEEMYADIALQFR